MRNRLLLAGLSGLLFWASWPTSPLTPLIFIALVPLFFIHKQINDDTTIKKKGNVFFRYVYLALFLWNLLATWWVWNASAGGAVQSAHKTLCWFVLVGWAIYPIGYMAGTEGWYSGIFGGLDMDVIYNVGDAINKIGFGLVVYQLAVDSK